MANRIKGITVEIGGDTTEQLQNGEISQEQYDALQREIAETEVFHNSRCHTINRYSVQDCKSDGMQYANSTKQGS